MTDKDPALITGFPDNELTDPEIVEFKLRYGHIWNKKWVYRIAAVVVPLVALGIGIMLGMRTGLSADELYLTYWQKSQPIEGVRSFSGEPNEDFQLLQSEIDKAILETMQQFYPGTFFLDTDSDSRLFLREIIIPDSAALIERRSEAVKIHDFGLFCMKGQRFLEAIFAFRQIIGMNEKSYLESSEWYLGLCYLKSGDLENAKQVFSSIAGNPGHKFYSESKKILRKIK
jgi:hypothetical protein